MNMSAISFCDRRGVEWEFVFMPELTRSGKKQLQQVIRRRPSDQQLREALFNLGPKEVYRNGWPYRPAA